MNQEEFINAWTGWLAQRQWDFFATLTFRSDVTATAGKRRVGYWLRDIKNTASEPEFCWVRAGEIGPGGGRYHCHVLLGRTQKFDITQWAERWQRTGGHAWIEKFDTQRGSKGIRYLLKGLHPGADYDLDFRLPADKPRASSHPSRMSDRQIGKQNVLATVTQDHAVCVRISNNSLIIKLPLLNPKPSKSGKRNLVATSHGVLVTPLSFHGHCIAVNVNAFIDPKGVPWKERLKASIARAEGRLK
jgi:hypothetical protein